MVIVSEKKNLCMEEGWKVCSLTCGSQSSHRTTIHTLFRWFYHWTQVTEAHVSKTRLHGGNFAALLQKSFSIVLLALRHGF